MSRAGRSAISPSTSGSGCTRSGLLVCLEEGQGREPEGTAGAGTVSHNLGQGFRVALQRSPVLVGRGHGTGGTDLRGLEVVGRPLPALRVRQEVANGDSRDVQQEVVELPDVIDLSDDEIDLYIRFISQVNAHNNYNEVDRAPAQQDTTAASQSRISLSDDEMDMLDLDLAADPAPIQEDTPAAPQRSISLNTTIDLTRSPERPVLSILLLSSLYEGLLCPVLVLSHTQNTTSPGCSTVPPSTIQCPVCLDSLSTIRSKGNNLLSTTCGHVFCSSCLPECVRLHSKCPTCRQKMTNRDYHELFLN